MKLTGKQVRAMMRANHKTIAGIARQYNLTQTRVRTVRANGVQGDAFVRDWLEILA
jgi:hypothetical protein